MGKQVIVTDTPFNGEYGPAPGAPPPSPTKLSEYGDLMVAYSTIPGFVSWRNETNGSWFIQDLFEVFMNHSHDTPLYKMLRMVKQQQQLETRETAAGCKQGMKFDDYGFVHDLYFNPGVKIEYNPTS